ncbi:methyltransferase, FkbM family [Aliiroseovarius sediminilitoris]|uniref:Methyltransferase, FkbM family n=1 Tax=Aliiroseovarius sediminilitoris TaxID=1173584 RepID=A0A1I0R994_9RHOB|nr:FkbM family methyltransferase [Aliiroseovarius sediminilitoris]SEW37371.1 methyltransferase, FkbM family [Aliiroseovarius sediminilitoris]
MQDTDGPQALEIAKLTQQLEKLMRRQARNQRAAHAKGLLQGICSMLKPGDVVLDCGANIGEVTVPLAKTGAHIHAFEPDPYAFGKLSDATRDLDNVTLHNAAVGTKTGTINLMRAENFGDNPRGASVKSTVISGGRKIDETTENTLEVPLISLPDFLADLTAKHGQIAFLKMDIEGAELEILEAMLADGLFDKITLTVAETHENKFKALRDRFRALRAAVAKAHPPTRVNLDWI